MSRACLPYCFVVQIRSCREGCREKGMHWGSNQSGESDNRSSCSCSPCWTVLMPYLGGLVQCATDQRVYVRARDSTKSDMIRHIRPRRCGSTARITRIRKLFKAFRKKVLEPNFGPGQRLTWSPAVAWVWFRVWHIGGFSSCQWCVVMRVCLHDANAWTSWRSKWYEELGVRL